MQHSPQVLLRWLVFGLVVAALTVPAATWAGADAARTVGSGRARRHVQHVGSDLPG